VAANQASLLFFQQEAVAIAGRPFFDHLPVAGDLGDVRDHLEKLLSGADKTPVDLIVDFELKGRGLQSLRLRLSRADLSATPEGRRIVVIVDDPLGHDSGTARQARVAAVFRKASGSTVKAGSLSEALEVYVPLICELTDWPLGHFWLSDDKHSDQIRGD